MRYILWDTALLGTCDVIQDFFFIFIYKSIAYMTTTHGTVTYITYRRKKNYLQINYLHFLRDSYLVIHNLQKQRLITNQCLHY